MISVKIMHNIAFYAIFLNFTDFSVKIAILAKIAKFHKIMKFYKIANMSYVYDMYHDVNITSYMYTHTYNMYNM